MWLALRRVVPIVALGVVPIVLFAVVVARARGEHVVALDFHNELYPQAKLVVHGRNPFPPPDADLSSGVNRIFTVAAALLAAPLVLLPSGLADGVMTGLVTGSALAALFVLGVRDWRVYGASFLWPPVLSAVQTANLTLPLCLCGAVAWAYRDRRCVPGVAVGVAIALKLFPWPLVVWLVATRRFVSAVLAAGIGVGSLLLVLPFTSLRAYGSLMRNLSDTFDDQSYSVFGLLVKVGVDTTTAKVVWLVLGGAVLVLGRRSFALCVIASLLLSPIVWLHYFALLLLPLAATRAKLWAWLIPLAMWPLPGTGNGGSWQIVLSLAVLAAVALITRVHRTPNGACTAQPCPGGS